MDRDVRPRNPHDGDAVTGAIWVSDPEFNRFDPETGTYETRSISGFVITSPSKWEFTLHAWAGNDWSETFFNSLEACEIAAALTKATGV